MMTIYGFAKKVRQQRNNICVKNLSYDRLFFFQFLAQQRVRHNHEFTNWGLVTTCSYYAKGHTKSVTKTSSFFGFSTSTFTKHIWLTHIH